MSGPIVEARGLTRTYKMGRGQIRALDGVDLVVERGELLAVIGRSGSGKSTLLNLLGCLDRPTAGTIWIDGVDVTRVPPGKLPSIRRSKIGFVFQQHNVLPILTALENVELPLRYAGLDPGRRRKLAEEALGAVELGDRLHHRPAELSGGEVQRVAIARALVNSPAIVLADEPTGELDTHTASHIMDRVVALNAERGTTFIIVTHDPLIADRTRRTIRLQDGKIESDVRTAFPASC